MIPELTELNEANMPSGHLKNSQNFPIEKGSQTGAVTDLFRVRLDRKEFKRLSELISSECGIRMPEEKKIMLETRLRKRLRALRMRSFSTYCDYLFSPEGEKNELVRMIDTVTTNKSDFFREPDHFTFFTKTALPHLINRSSSDIQEKITVWSAGCATGEEPYTLAMVLHDFKRLCPGLDFTIIATDISTRVLEKAQAGIYPMDKADQVPEYFRKKYLLRSKDESRKLIRVIPALRKSVQFQRLNFMDNSYDINTEVDVIFCRNVMIYFERPMQEKILQKVCRHLRKGGYIFAGYSESLYGMSLPLQPVALSVYKKEEI